MCLIFFSSIFNSYLSDNSFLRLNVGIIDIKLALPHLSPRPFIVPWICLAPDKTAAIEFATALPVSLCACIPKFSPGICSDTSLTILVTSWGRVPPFVSHNTIHLAPLSKAALMHSNAYFGFDL